MKEFLEDLGQKPLTPDVIREYLNQGCEKVKEFEPEAFLIVGIKAEGEDIHSMVVTRFSCLEFVNILNGISRISPEIHQAMCAFSIEMLCDCIEEKDKDDSRDCPDEFRGDKSDA